MASMAVHVAMVSAVNLLVSEVPLEPNSGSQELYWPDIILAAIGARTRYTSMSSVTNASIV